MERSKFPEISNIHVSTVLYQHFCHFVVPIGTGVMKRNQSTADILQLVSKFISSVVLCLKSNEQQNESTINNLRYTDEKVAHGSATKASSLCIWSLNQTDLITIVKYNNGINDYQLFLVILNYFNQKLHLRKNIFQLIVMIQEIYAIQHLGQRLDNLH